MSDTNVGAAAAAAASAAEEQGDVGSSTPSSSTAAAEDQYLDLMHADVFVHNFFDHCRFFDSDDSLAQIQQMLASDEGKEKKLVSQTDNKTGRTALHMAASNGHVDVIRVLLEAGANINAQAGTSGATPLHDAVLARGLKAVPMLLAAGADSSLRNSTGETALALSETLGYEELSSLLLKEDKTIDSYQNAAGKIVMEQVEGGGDDDYDDDSDEVAAAAAGAAASGGEQAKKADVDDVE
jgi:ankyrin repeat protein